MITISDNFLDDVSYKALNNTSMVYAKVHWIGIKAAAENSFHDFIHKIFRHAWPDGNGAISGATAWWNIRPTDPKPHSDLISYCTSGGIDYTPKNPPKRTFIYYLKAPDSGGRLNIYTKPPGITEHLQGGRPPAAVKLGIVVHNKPYIRKSFRWPDHEIDSIAPIANRLISFPIQHTHAVQAYTGNRISIGAIFWSTLPTIYGPTNPNINDSYDRPWEKSENQESNRKRTETHIVGHPKGYPI